MTKTFAMGSREMNQIRAVTNQFLAKMYVQSISAILVPCLDRKVSGSDTLTLGEVRPVRRKRTAAAVDA